MSTESRRLGLGLSKGQNRDLGSLPCRLRNRRLLFTAGLHPLGLAPSQARALSLSLVAAFYSTSAFGADPPTAPQSPSPPTASASTAATPATTPVPQQIEVTGKLRSVQTLIDRKVYKLKDDIQALTGSAAEVLNSIPSVEVDVDGRVSLRGDGSVTILIDGKPSTLLSGSNGGDGLLQFSARDIDRIEVMTSPPAQYKAAGTGGVINIITKKNRQGGASGGVQFSVGDHDRYVLGANAGYSASDWNLSAGIGLREDYRQRRVRTALAIPSSGAGPVLGSTQALDEHIRRSVPSLKLGLDWKVSDTQSASAGFNMRQRIGNRAFDQHNQSLLADGSIASVTNRHSDGHERARNQDASLSFKQVLRDPSETLELSLHRSTEHERERYAYLNTPVVPTGSTSRDNLYLNQDLLTDELGLDYSVALVGEQSLKLGAALQRDNNAFDTEGDNVDPVSSLAIPNLLISNQYHYQQSISAIYGSYKRTLDVWSTVAGLRVERATGHSDQINTGIQGRQRFSGVYPSLRLEREIDPSNTLSLGYSKRVSRPDGEALNPFVDRQDIHNLRAGNTNLVPQETQALEVGYQQDAAKQAWGVTAYLRDTRNSVTSVTQLVSADVTLSTLANLPRSRALGLEFNREGALGTQWSYRYSGNAFRSQIDATALGFSNLRTTTGVNAKASLDYRPTAVDAAQLSVSRTDKRLTPQGMTAAINLVNAGYRHQFQPELALFATVSDLFNGQRFRRVLTTSALAQSYERQQLGRVAFIGLSYNFGGNKKGKAAAFDYDAAN